MLAFEMDCYAAPESPIDMSFLNPEPAGSSGFVRVEGAQFVDGSGERLRLLGTNFTFSGAFPEQSKAETMAARLRAFGANVVRFHHMDTRGAPDGLWNEARDALDPAQLDRLDTIIYQLKQHGIYSNLNLHVSRSYPGLPEDDRTYVYGKVLDNFYPEYIDLQKQYARMLLTHVNPHTGKPYAQEPAICAVEINNENTLLGAPMNLLAQLPEPFLSELTRQWQGWLLRRYGDTDALRAEWNAGSEPLGDELLTNGDFAEGTQQWNFEQNNGAKMEVSTGDGPEAGQSALVVRTLAKGQEAWNLQVHQIGLTLEDEQTYTLSFQAKADTERTVNVGARLDQAPWSFAGLQANPTLTTQWQQFDLGFHARGTLPEHVRISFNLNNELGEFHFANVSLRPGGVFGIPEDQTLEAGNVAIPPDSATPAMSSDFTAFKMDTERAYVAEMVRFLKEDLGVQAPIVDTQASYGGIGGVYREGTLCDYVDIHSYWQHPVFPNRPWDGSDWRIGNTPMTRDANGGTLARLAAHRVAGLPFTVSEYDHPAPSEYSAEMFPMLAAFASLQDWDGLYQFNYQYGDEPRLRSYFNMAHHPAKMCFLPVAAVMFRMGAVAPAQEAVTLTVPHDAVLGQQVSDSSATAIWSRVGVPSTASLIHRLQVALQPGDGEVSASREVAVPDGLRESDTGEVAWDTSDPSNATFQVTAPAVRAVTGYVAGREFDLGGVRVKFGQTANNFASFALAALDGKPIADSEKLLIVGAGRVENTGMEWNEEHNSVSNKWGSAPTLVEGIPLEVTIPGSFTQAGALNGVGEQTREVPTQVAGGETSLTLGPEHGTLWYVLAP